MKILFITRKSTQCGVADYGKRLYSILKQGMDITLLETEGEPIDYSGYDIALYNYHYATMPFINTGNRNIKHVALFHEAFQNHLFDLIIPVTELPRPIYQGYDMPEPVNSIPLIGSFGFGFPDKNFVGIARMVKEQFASAKLRLHVPFAEFGDATGDMALARVYECRNELAGSNIELQVECRFMPPTELIGWLAENDINVFNCVPSHGRGISSSIDYALAARRPIAVSNSEMYKHMPREICLDNATLPELIAKGLDPLKQVYEDNSNDKLIEAVKDWLSK